MNTTDRTGTIVTNIMTVDVEDWYRDTDISTWELYEDRIVESTKYDETFSDKEIGLIEKLLSASIEKGKIKDQNDINKALQ